LRGHQLALISMVYLDKHGVPCRQPASPLAYLKKRDRCAPLFQHVDTSHSTSRGGKCATSFCCCSCCCPGQSGCCPSEGTQEAPGPGTAPLCWGDNRIIKAAASWYVLSSSASSEVDSSARALSSCQTGRREKQV
jgi:hypothetical protein